MYAAKSSGRNHIVCGEYLLREATYEPQGRLTIYCFTPVFCK
jgi:hypothetical protein